ncbi:MAG: hypothetical protein ACOC10_09450 [Bacteroidota bacterium]
MLLKILTGAKTSIHDCIAGDYLRAIIRNDPSIVCKRRWAARLFQNFSKANLKSLHDQVINDFGTDRVSEYIFYKKKSLYISICDYYITGKQIHLDRAKIFIQEIERISRKGESSDPAKSIYANNRNLYKWSGRNPELITVFEYYNDIRDYEKEMSKIKMQALKTN